MMNKRYFSVLSASFLMLGALTAQAQLGRIVAEDAAKWEQMKKTANDIPTPESTTVDVLEMKSLSGADDEVISTPSAALPAPDFDATSLKFDLPAAFDWREYDAMTPVENHYGLFDPCKSSWAFAATHLIESAIKLRDGVEVSLSEQWLISCTGSGSCDGYYRDISASEYGDVYTALQHFLDVKDSSSPNDGVRVDFCDDSGSVSEADYPYTLNDAESGGAPCTCPDFDEDGFEDAHSYFIDAIGLVSNDQMGNGNVKNDALKRAILDYGPVAVQLRRNSSFTGGPSDLVFDSCSGGWEEYYVILVGWDDTLGTRGAWIVKNSMGTGWGFDGYAYVEYDCLGIGDNGVYVIYNGDPLLDANDMRVLPYSDFLQNVEEDQEIVPNYKVYELTNIYSSAPIEWRVDWTVDWLDVEPSSGIIFNDETQLVKVTLNENAESLDIGTYADVLLFTDLNTRQTKTRMVTLNIVEEKTAAVMVLIEPTEAVANGAQWRLNDSPNVAWQDSGDVIRNLPTMDYTVSFREAEGYVTPTDITITEQQMNSEQISVITIKYIKDSIGAFSVTLPDDMELNINEPITQIEGQARGGMRPYQFQWSVSQRPPGSGRVNFTDLASVYSKVSASISDPVLAGDYTITLSATDSDGREASDSMIITVKTMSSDDDDLPDMDVDTDQPTESKDPIVINPNGCAPTTMASLSLTLFGLLVLRVVNRRRY